MGNDDRTWLCIFVDWNLVERNRNRNRKRSKQKETQNRENDILEINWAMWNVQVNAPGSFPNYFRWLMFGSNVRHLKNKISFHTSRARARAHARVQPIKLNEQIVRYLLSLRFFLFSLFLSTKCHRSILSKQWNTADVVFIYSIEKLTKNVFFSSFVWLFDRLPIIIVKTQIRQCIHS